MPAFLEWSTPAMQRRRTLNGLLALAVAAKASAGNATGVANATPPLLRLTGSSTVYPIVEEWQQSLGAAFSWQSKAQMRTGSGTGAVGVCLPRNDSRKVDVGCMSREWKSSEALLLDDGYTHECTATKIRFTQLVVGLDGLAVVVAKKSVGDDCLMQPDMGALTSAQLRWMFSNYNDSQLAGVNLASVAPNDDHDGIKEWSDLSSSCEHVPINTYGPGPVSGTHEFFGSAVMPRFLKGEDFRRCSRATNDPMQTMTADADIASFLRNPALRPVNCMVESIADDLEQVMKWTTSDPLGIAFLGLAWYNEQVTKLTAAPIADDPRLGASDTKEAKVAPTTFSVIDGSYALFKRNLYMNVDNSAWPTVKPFFQFGFSPAGQVDVTATGYIAINPGLVARMNIRVAQGGNPTADYIPVPKTSCPAGTEMLSIPYVNQFGNPKLRYDCVPCSFGFSKRETTPTLCSPCSPGSFAATRGRSSCSFCTAGFFSNSAAANCTQCPIGSIAALPGQGSCTKCDDGMYSSAPGSVSCSRCEAGKYRNGNLTECRACPPDMTTRFMGASKREDCACQAGMYHDSGVLAGTAKEGPCLPCPKGMECGFGSLYDNIAVWTQENRASIPEVSAGYFSLIGQPLSIYRCRTDGCMGGGTEQCSGGRVGLVCAFCPQGQSLKDGACATCRGESQAFTVIIPFAGYIFVLICYYLSNSRLTVNANIALAHSITFGMLITIIQVLSTYKDLGIPWPTDFEKLFGSLAFFTGSPKVLSYECMLGQEALKQYAIRCSLPLIFVGMVWSLYLVSKIIACCSKRSDVSWEINKTCNCIGQVLQAVFIGLATITVVPLQCYSHPNGMSSLTHSPEMLCWTSEHTPMLALAALVAICFVLPYYSMCIWASISVVRNVHAAGSSCKVVRYRFLLYRFRPDRWWWSNIFNTRQLLLAFASALPSDMPHGQAIYVAGVFTIYAILNAHFWPWKTTGFNLFDTIVSTLLTLIVVSATSFLPEDNVAREGYTILMVILLCFLAISSSLMYLLFVYYICRHGSIWGSFGAEKVKGYGVEEITRKWIEATAMCKELGDANVLASIKAMNKFDRQALLQAMAAWQATHPECFKGTLSVWRLAGIANTRSSFAVKSAQRFQTVRASSFASADLNGAASASPADAVEEEPEPSEVGPGMSWDWGTKPAAGPATVFV